MRTTRLLAHFYPVLLLLTWACGESNAPAPAMQFVAENRTSDTLIVWWWWKGIRSADIPGDPVVLAPNAGLSRCVTFIPDTWAQIDAAQGSRDRNSSAGDWRDNTITIDPARTSYWMIRAAGPGQPPTVSEQLGPVC